MASAFLTENNTLCVHCWRDLQAPFNALSVLSTFGSGDAQGVSNASARNRLCTENCAPKIGPNVPAANGKSRFGQVRGPEHRSPNTRSARNISAIQHHNTAYNNGTKYVFTRSRSIGKMIHDELQLNVSSLTDWGGGGGGGGSGSPRSRASRPAVIYIRPGRGEPAAGPAPPLVRSQHGTNIPAAHRHRRTRPRDSLTGCT